MNIGLYAPLREGIKDLNGMMRDQQVFDAQMKMADMKMQEQHNMNMMQLEFQKADAEREAKARQLYADEAAGLLGDDPYTNLANKHDGLVAQIGDLEQSAKKYKGNWRDAKTRLMINTQLSALRSEYDMVHKQLNDPIWIADQYQTKAAKLAQLSGKMGQYDLKSATMLQNAASQALNQGEMFQAQARIAKENQIAPVEEMAYRVDKDGNIIDSQIIAYKKTPGMALSPMDASPEIADRTAKGERWVWSDQYKTEHVGQGKGEDKTLITRVRTQMRQDLIGKEMTFPGDAKNAMANFAEKLYDKYTTEHEPANEAQALQLAQKAKTDARLIHNKYVSDRPKIEAMQKELIKAGKITREEAEAELKAKDDMARIVFGYLPEVPYDEQFGGM